MRELIKPFISIILVALLAATIIYIMPVSCEKEKPEEVGPTETEPTGTAQAPTTPETAPPGQTETGVPPTGRTDTTGGEITPTAVNTIYFEDFETTPLFDGAYDPKSDLCCSYSLTQVSSPVFSGAKSGRFELRDTDPLVSNSRRSEVTVVKGNITKDTWYSFASYYPSAGYEYDTQQEVLCQWYQSGSPATAFRTKKDRFLLLTGNSLSPDNRQEVDLGPIAKDTWHQWVFHFIHSYGSDGLIEIWHNGTKVLTRQGGNSYSDGLPKWKLGVYKSSFKDLTSTVHKRIVYYDNVKVGNQYATYAEMAPSASGSTATTTSGTTTTTTGTTTSGTTTTGTTTAGTTTTGTTTSTTTAPPTTSGTTTTTTGTPTTTGTTTTGPKVVSFTIVNSTTEKDVATIANGGSYSLKTLGTTKINIRANTSPSTVGSVTFVLSGAYARTSTDSAVPYALQGDDGVGNYYAWAPVAGSYTLKATPYSDKYGKGTAGTPLTVSFTIKP